MPSMALTTYYQHLLGIGFKTPHEYNLGLPVCMLRIGENNVSTIKNIKKIHKNAVVKEQGSCFEFHENLVRNEFYVIARQFSLVF